MQMIPTTYIQTFWPKITFRAQAEANIKKFKYSKIKTKKFWTVDFITLSNKAEKYKKTIKGGWGKGKHERCI